jgi:hypothetical protein
MSIKSQLHSSRDFLMVGMRKAARGPAPNAQTEKLLGACVDLVDQLARQPDLVTVPDLEKTLGVLHQAASELDDGTSATSAVVGSIQQAIGRLQSLRAELAVT